MNKVALAGAIRSCIILAINLEALTLSCGNLQQNRDKMSLGLMSLSQFPCGSRTREIPEGGRTPSVGAGIPPQNQVKDQLGFSRRIKWPGGSLFVNGHGLGCSVDRRRR